MVVCKPFMRPCEDGLSPSWMVFGGSSSQLGAQTNHQCIGEIHKWPEDSHRKEKTQPPFTSVSVIFHAKYFVVGEKKKHVFLRRRAAWRWQSLSIPLGPSYPLNPGSDNEFPQGPGPGVHLFSPEHERGIAFSSPPAFKIGS